MKTFQEPKFQRWRAVVRMKDGRVCLLCLGMTYMQVKDTYGACWNDMDEDDHRLATEIYLQRWNGAPDMGKWVMQSTLPFPRRKG